MSADDNEADDQADSPDSGDDPPLTVELLANLQAGLLDDAAAARVRSRIRADPTATVVLRALNRVRGDIAALATDTTSANRYPRAAHALRPSGNLVRGIAAGAGLCALIAAVGLGAAALVGAPTFTADPASSTPTAQHITVSSPNAVIPLTAEQILDLLDHQPNYGPLSDPVRRASCLTGLGYPASTPILGARLIEINGDQGVLLVLPGDTADKLVGITVPATCSSADTGLLATTVLARR